MRSTKIRYAPDPLERLKIQILRKWRQHKIMIYPEDITDTVRSLERGLGVYLGARGLVLGRCINQMIRDGRVVVFITEGRLAFLPRSQWEREIREDPALQACELTSDPTADNSEYPLEDWEKQFNELVNKGSG